MTVSKQVLGLSAEIPEFDYPALARLIILMNAADEHSQDDLRRLFDEAHRISCAERERFLKEVDLSPLEAIRVLRSANAASRLALKARGALRS